MFGLLEETLGEDAFHGVLIVKFGILLVAVHEVFLLIFLSFLNRFQSLLDTARPPCLLWLSGVLGPVEFTLLLGTGV